MKQNGFGRADVKLARLFKARENIEARITLARKERAEAVIARLLDAGVDWLSSAKLEEVVEIIRAAAPNPAEASNHHGPEDLVKVQVKMSANASPTKKGLLNTAGLRWSGKQGRYVGVVSKAVVARLMEQFPDRVNVVAAEGVVGDAPPSTAVPTIEAPSVVAEPAAAPEPAERPEADQEPLPVPPSTAVPVADDQPVAAAELTANSEPAAPREVVQLPPQAPQRVPVLARQTIKP